MKNDFRHYLANLVKARFPLIYISTWEETRATSLIYDTVTDVQIIKKPRELFVWSQTQGMRSFGANNKPDVKTPLKALEMIENYDEPAVFILKDLHVYFGGTGKQADYALIRKIRDLVSILKESAVPKSIIFLSPILVLPDDLQKDVTVVDFSLPTLEEIQCLLQEMIDVNSSSIKIDLNESERNQLCKSALGLTLQEAENAFARAMVERGCLTINEMEIVLDEKCQVIKKTGVLEFVKSELSVDDIGGLENLKRWLHKRNKSWLDSAQKYNIPAPKGILITGVPGCGKSLTAKAISAMWKLPLLKLDMGKIFSGIVGSSEENMRKAIKTAEAVAPSILWIDEIEKGFGSVSGGGDSGTSARIFGTFLTWMQEKSQPVFVIATANNISQLPSEMLRKGRFDEIFFVDLPTLKERKDIFKLHLSKKLTHPDVTKMIAITDDFLLELSQMTEGFSGAEIEQIVISALFEAFSQDRPLLKEDLIKSTENMIPLSVTQSEQIVQIRNWANVRAVAATATEDRNEYKVKTKEMSVLPTGNTSSENADEIVKRNRGGRPVDF